MRPAHSPLAFVPITFETAVLMSCMAIFFSLMALFGFPRVTHPVFELEAFRTASIDGFWVSLATEDAELRARAVEALRAMRPKTVSVIEGRA